MFTSFSIDDHFPMLERTEANRFTSVPLLTLPLTLAVIFLSSWLPYSLTQHWPFRRHPSAHHSCSLRPCPSISSLVFGMFLFPPMPFPPPSNTLKSPPKAYINAVFHAFCCPIFLFLFTINLFKSNPTLSTSTSSSLTHSTHFRPCSISLLIFWSSLPS